MSCISSQCYNIPISKESCRKAVRVPLYELCGHNMPQQFLARPVLALKLLILLSGMILACLLATTDPTWTNDALRRFSKKEWFLQEIKFPIAFSMAPCLQFSSFCTVPSVQILVHLRMKLIKLSHLCCSLPILCCQLSWELFEQDRNISEALELWNQLFACFIYPTKRRQVSLMSTFSCLKNSASPTTLPSTACACTTDSAEVTKPSIPHLTKKCQIHNPLSSNLQFPGHLAIPYNLPLSIAPYNLLPKKERYFPKSQSFRALIQVMGSTSWQSLAPELTLFVDFWRQIFAGPGSKAQKTKVSNLCGNKGGLSSYLLKTKSW